MKYFSTFSGIGEAKKLYEDGFTQQEIANKLGVTQKVIWGAFKRDGYKCRIAKKRNQFGSNNDSWKGDWAGYAALHIRVENKRGKPSICSMCDTKSAKRYEWANMTGKYEDIYDYIRVCKSCHHKIDNIISNITKEK